MRNLFLVLLCAALPACLGIDGNGKRAHETRHLDDFTRIENAGPFDVAIRQGDHFEVEVSIDSNLIDNLETIVHGNTLRIDSERSIAGTLSGPHVRITMPRLQSIRLNGSGDVQAGAFEEADPIELEVDGSGDLSFEGSAPELVVTLDGSGDVHLIGETKFASIEASGSGDLDARQLIADEADVDLNGSGDVSLTVNGPVDVSLDGSGDIDLFGEVERRHFHEDGSGDISVH